VQFTGIDDALIDTPFPDPAMFACAHPTGDATTVGTGVGNRTRPVGNGSVIVTSNAVEWPVFVMLTLNVDNPFEPTGVNDFLTSMFGSTIRAFVSAEVTVGAPLVVTLK
jgi:hypothetical protein